MQSKSHILKIMTRLLLLWMKHPGLRLGQLIENVYPCNPPEGVDTCIYYMKDEKLIKSLEEHYEDV